MSKEIPFLTFQLLHNELIHHMIENGAEDDPEARYQKIEELGFSIGQKFFDIITCSKSIKADTTKDKVTFICTEFWKYAFGANSKVDRLKTDHKSVYALIVGDFPILRQFIGSPIRPEIIELCQQYLIMPCGMIRGVAFAMGLKCTVSASVEDKKLECAFKIHI
eukprot:TRINITY_DN7720_c0_g1_i1.p1 TRINITY_DN7720_c0_g1~~TRINITY_DN7720_c0_g1_i1.p1  ORF type:complete len:164 (+),score=24.01 TRINITY_DN7720_c0_g1_i1:116-607(+)